MAIIDTSHVNIAIKSYGEHETSDAHEFVQLVLPVSGEVRIVVDDSRRLLNPLSAAIVPAGTWHAQHGVGDNRSIIVDVDPSVFTGTSWDRLVDLPFTGIGAAARKLIEFMQISIEMKTATDAQLRGWLPLLFDTMAAGGPQLQSRLAVLLVQIEANPALPWTTNSMAGYARLSVSRLHALFKEELNTSPHAWLLQKRLTLACELLARTNRAIIDIALSVGFADQSAFTRSMRQHLATTPAAFRQHQQEITHKSQ